MTAGPAKISGDVLTLTGTGSVVVEAKQAGNGDYEPATPVTKTIAVNKAKLTLTANNLTVKQGAAVPKLTYTLSGFVNADTQAKSTTGQPTLTTSATSKSKPGAYPITIKLGTLASTDYYFNEVNGTLTIAN